MTDPHKLIEFTDVCRRVALTITRITELADALRVDVTRMSETAIELMAEATDSLSPQDQ